MGRPALAEEQKRKIQVNIRLTEEENRKAERYAQSSGISPANWIRQKVFSGKFPPLKISPLDAAVYRELHKIGVNLNQAMKTINGGRLDRMPEVILNELLEMQKEIIRRLIQ